jgi:hypothetical protein
MYKKIKSKDSYEFNILESGIYSITIKASCQSGGFLGFFGGEDLRVEIENPEESIFWGVRWLYYKAQIAYGVGKNQLRPPITREWKIWEQAVIDYNDSNRKQEYQINIWRIYKEGIDPDGNFLWGSHKNGYSKLKALLFVLLGFFIFIFGVHYDNNYHYCVEREEERNVKATENDVFAPSISAYELTKNVFLEDFQKYKEEKYFSNFVFKNTKETCQENNCYMEEVLRFYYDDLVANMNSNRHFLGAVSVFDYLSDIQTGDIDNDGENEILFIERDTSNRQYVNIMIIDKVKGEFKLLENKIPEVYDAYIKLLDTTGDIQPEILFFMSQGGVGYPLYIYQYLDDKTIEELAFERDFIWGPELCFLTLMMTA